MVERNIVLRKAKVIFHSLKWTVRDWNPWLILLVPVTVFVLMVSLANLSAGAAIPGMAGFVYGTTVLFWLMYGSLSKFFHVFKILNAREKAWYKTFIEPNSDQ